MICIAIPTRGRPEYVESLTSSALSTASDPKNVVIKYYLNDNDKTIEDYKKTFKQVQSKYGKSIQYTIGPDQNTILSWNEMCESTKADYFMLTGDEVIFETKHWDIKFTETKKKYPDGIFVMAMFCGRENRAEKKQCVTPVVTKEWKKALGYFWGPMFWHWNVDQWTGELAKAVDRFVYRKDITVRIKKMKDDTGLRNRSEGIFKRDKWTYQKCKEIYFPYDVQKLKKAIK